MNETETDKERENHKHIYIYIEIYTIVCVYARQHTHCASYKKTPTANPEDTSKFKIGM